MKYYVCLGDRTTGGGVVIEGNIQTIILGRPVASMGMKAICCNRPQTILQGWTGHLDHGKQIAYDGCLLSCGHKVVASQNLMGWSDGSGGSDVPEDVELSLYQRKNVLWRPFPPCIFRYTGSP